MTSPGSVYRIFRRGSGEVAVLRPVIVALVIVAVALAMIGSIQVSRQHDVLRSGYELSRRSEQVGRLRETQRRLELEHAMLSTPERIRRLATRLGMTSVAPDRIRVVNGSDGVAAIPEPRR
ncbi:MAG: cell division protein FtsL [Deltaproteobacteria bacterium]|nr:cell division protein FtsL [Deltaproteobacteria bacterium]